LVPALERLEGEGMRIEAIHPIRDLPGVAEMVSLMREQGIRRFVAAGGDGTAGAVVNAIVHTDAVLGILPLGTSNDFARSLGLSMDIKQACRTIARGSQRTIDLGSATTDDGIHRYFAHAATVGLNTHFARVATSPQWRHRYGRFSYPAAALRAIRDRESIEMRIIADGKELRGRVVQASVLNAPIFGGAMGFRVPDATLTDRRLDLIVVGNVTPKVLARALLVALGGKRRRISLAHLTHPRCVRIETDRPRDVYCDGERMGMSPVTIESANRALTVLN
jgi:YegS/Rv2252/BmrU family lipid kinase